jgi:hypothetical protein
LNHFFAGTLAMSKTVETGILVGRPFGGIGILIKSSLRNATRTVSCTDWYALVKIRNYIIVSVYLPRCGTVDRLLLCNNILDDIWSWQEQYNSCDVIIGGDFNANLDSTDIISDFISTFSAEYSLIRCDELFPRANTATYVNSSLNLQSCINYMLVSSHNQVVGYDVIDPDINFSDPLPLFTSFVSHNYVTMDKLQT